MNPSELSWNVHVLRQRAGLTQTQLGIRLGCRTTVIIQIERGFIELPRVFRPRLARILGVSLDTLLGERLGPV